MQSLIQTKTDIAFSLFLLAIQSGVLLTVVTIMGVLLV